MRGCYRFGSYGEGAAKVTLMGSGAILTEVIRAAQQLASEGVPCEVFSVTSWSELARDGVARDREAADGGLVVSPFVASQLGAKGGPIVAATDYVRAVPESVREFLPTGRRFVTLGTDGFGRSDTRAALRAFFRVDAASIVAAARRALAAG